MPDPAKSLADIDDVLSSIRRLVADQPDRDLPEGGKPLSISAHAGEESGPAPTDKLLLTPALRVTDGDAANPGDGGLPPVGPGTDAQLVEADIPIPDEGSDPAPRITGDSTVGAEDVIPSDMRVDMPDADDPTSALEASDGADDIGHAISPTPPSDTERAVGSEGWRAEMRLHDWQSGAARATADTPAAGLAPMRDFEPESDDADWPDMGTHRALLDLAAARAVPPSDAPQDGTTGSEVTDRAAASQPDAGADEHAPNETGPAQTRPAFSRRTDPVSALSSATDAPRAHRPANVTLNPFSAAAGSDVGGEHSDDWGHDDAFAGISDNPEDDDAALKPPEAAVADVAPAGHGASDESPPLEPGLAQSDAAQRHASKSHAGPAVGASEASRVGEAGAPSVADPASGGPAMPPAGADETARKHWADNADRDLAARPEPDGASDTQPVSETMILHSPIAPGMSAPTDDVDVPDTTILDEDTLRRIVAEVVREELQGALGERITRNIRKLVRREIRLVLASDEAD
jgi:hypothetical protein